MSIRKKTLLVLGFLAFIMIATLYGVLSLVLEAGFHALEVRDANINMQRVREAFAQQEREVCTRTIDWAQWDDTWIFAEDRNPAYATSNTENLAFAGMKLNMLLIADKQGNVLSAVQMKEMAKIH